MMMNSLLFLETQSLYNCKIKSVIQSGAILNFVLANYIIKMSKVERLHLWTVFGSCFHAVFTKLRYTHSCPRSGHL